MFLIIFAILDRVDGEIARYRKVISFRGKYLGLLAHYITEISQDIGLFLGVYFVLQDNLVLLFGFIMFLFGILIKFAVSSNMEIMYKDGKIWKLSKRKERVKGQSILKRLMKELNVLIFSYMYTPYWIIVGAILDFLIPKSIIPFGSFLMLFIMFQAFVRFFKFFGAVLHFSMK